MNAHTHHAESITVMEHTRIEVCECGATRTTHNNATPLDDWHTCELCTHSWGRTLTTQPRLNRKDI